MSAAQIIDELPKLTPADLLAVRRKLMFAAKRGFHAVDALYDLQADPEELTNLIGNNPDREKHRAEAERMKSLLLAWLERTKSNQLDDVRKRPLIAD